jgi:mRNA interferase MazF
MKRGDVVTVVAAGDDGKRRPAVIVQTDALPAEHSSVVVCQMTPDGDEAPDFRVVAEPTEHNGLRARSHVMADKSATIRRPCPSDSVGDASFVSPAKAIHANPVIAGIADVCACGDDQRLAE